MKNKVIKHVSIYTLHKYYKAFALLYKIISAKDAYRIIASFYPELTKEEFLDDIKKQANDSRPWVYNIRLEGKRNDYWIINGLYVFDYKKEEEYKKLADQPLRILDKNEYEEIYCNIENKVYIEYGNKIKEHIIQSNPTASKQLIDRWCSKVCYPYTLTDVSTLIKDLIEAKCKINDLDYFKDLINKNNESIRSYGSRGFNLLEIKNNDTTNALQPITSFYKEHRIGFTAIYRLANAALNIYPALDNEKFVQIISRYYPGYDLEEETYDALKNYKQVSKNFHYGTFKVFSLKGEDTYGFDSFGNEYLFIGDQNIKNKYHACANAYWSHKNEIFYIPKDLDEFVSYGLYSYRTYNSYMQELDSFLRNVRSMDNHTICNELSNVVQYSNINIDKCIDLWFLWSKLNDSFYDKFKRLVLDYYKNTRIPYLFGFTRKEVEDNNIKFDPLAAAEIESEYSY